MSNNQDLNRLVAESLKDKTDEFISKPLDNLTFPADAFNVNEIKNLANEPTATMAQKRLNIGDKVWHRMFGWCVVQLATDISETVCVKSEHKHVQQYIMGYGWKDYIGTGKDGSIEYIALKKSELYSQPQDDRTQHLLKMTFKVLA